MAEIKHQFAVKAELLTTITLTESEVRALDGIFGYSPDAFIKAFYDKMGRAYVEPHEEGVRSLHKTIRSKTAPAIRKIDRIRKAIREEARVND